MFTQKLANHSYYSELELHHQLKLNVFMCLAGLAYRAYNPNVYGV